MTKPDRRINSAGAFSAIKVNRLIRIVKSMKNLMKYFRNVLSYSLIFFFLTGCYTYRDLPPDQMIKDSDCEKIVIQKENKYGVWEESYCLTTMDRLENLYRKECLAYVGSNDKYHFFYFFTKIAYYEGQPSAFEVLRSDYTPKIETSILENKIGEKPFRN